MNQLLVFSPHTKRSCLSRFSAKGYIASPPYDGIVFSLSLPTSMMTCCNIYGTYTACAVTCSKLRSSFPALSLHYIYLHLLLSLLCLVPRNAPQQPPCFLVKRSDLHCLMGTGILAVCWLAPRESPLIFCSSLCNLEKGLSPTRTDLLKPWKDESFLRIYLLKFLE